MSRKIDHIVYSVPDLEEACHYIKEKIGLTPVFGGYHKTKGTKNALLNLGNAIYLEILAIDYDNHLIQSDRWMGIDLVTKPQITRWALKTNQIHKDSSILNTYNPKMGQVDKGSRMTDQEELLSWSMILPLPKPIVEIAPFMVDWSESSFHPTDRLDNGCLLKEIIFFSDNYPQDQSLFANLNIDRTIKSGSKPKINILIEGPTGSMQL